MDFDARHNQTVPLSIMSMTEMSFAPGAEVDVEVGEELKSTDFFAADRDHTTSPPPGTLTTENSQASVMSTSPMIPKGIMPIDQTGLPSPHCLKEEEENKIKKINKNGIKY